MEQVGGTVVNLLAKMLGCSTQEAAARIEAKKRDRVELTLEQTDKLIAAIMAEPDDLPKLTVIKGGRP